MMVQLLLAITLHNIFLAIIITCGCGQSQNYCEDTANRTIDTLVISNRGGRIRCEDTPITFLWKCENGHPDIFDESDLRSKNCNWGYLSNARYFVECLVSTNLLYFCTQREPATSNSDHLVLRYINVSYAPDTATSELDVTTTSYITKDRLLVTDAPNGTTLPSTLTDTTADRNGLPIDPANGNEEINSGVISVVIAFSITIALIITVLVVLIVLALTMRRQLAGGMQLIFNWIQCHIEDKGGPDHNDDTIQKAERIMMNSCGAYNLVVPKAVVTEENPAYATIMR